MNIEEQYQIVVAETETQINKLKYLLQFKKEKAKLQKLQKLERSLELIQAMRGLINRQ